MQHFILTRFNIIRPGREAALRNTPGWLERRFDLFERFCLPSVAAQDQSDFTWLIYFDKDTPTQFRERIEAARALVPFEPRFVGIFSLSMSAADVEQRLRPGTSRVLTTRLDNDDAIACDFLSRIRQRAEVLPDGSVLNFPNGIAMKKGRLYAAYDASNPFTSLVESSRSVKTIWSAPHRQLGEVWNLVQVEGGPGWLQVVHGENVANRIKGARLGEIGVLEEFVISPETPLVKTGPLALALDRFGPFPMRRLRELAIKFLRPLRNALH